MLREELKLITLENLLDTNKISARTRNCCLSTGLYTLYDIVLYYEENISFISKKIKNAGKKTCYELDNLCKTTILRLSKEKKIARNENVIQIIDELSEQEQEMLLSLTNLVLESDKILHEKRKIYGNYCADDFVVDFYSRNGHLPMFWILEQYLISNKNRCIDILISTFPIFQNHQSSPLDDIAVKYSLTRERIRQIRNDTFHCTFEITDEIIEYKKNSNLAKYAQLLQNKDDWRYILNFLHEIEIINQESFELQECLKREQCNLSVVFVLQIIAYIFKDKYLIFGGLSISKQSKNNTFLISKKFTDVFNFEQFIEEFANHIADNKTEYDLNIDEFLSNSDCWIPIIDLDKFDSIIILVKDILLYEFHLYSNLDDSITIPATKERNPFEIVYEILRTKGEPMHIDDIFVEFKKIMPEHRYTEASQLRPYLQKHELISYRNRSSIYTLKEWGHIRTGTIRDAIIEFLTDKELPQSADKITEYILFYFPETNISSVRTSMFNDTQRRFSFFGDGLFGLANKVYPTEYEEIEQKEGQRKSFEQRLYDFEKFLTENDHFPFSTSDNEDEISLYRWWRIQNKNEDKLAIHQKKDIARIKDQYSNFDTDKAVYEWFKRFNDFKLFVLENRRLPFSSGSEKYLYSWFRRAKFDFLNDRLSDKQRTKYAALFKEIEYVER